MSMIHDELNKLGIACESISILQDKDGVTVARIISDKKPMWSSVSKRMNTSES